MILGSANIRIGLAQQDAPVTIPHCVARRTTGANLTPKRNVQDQVRLYPLLSIIYRVLRCVIVFYVLLLLSSVVNLWNVDA